MVMIDGDELRYYHPQYQQIQSSDERHFAELTDPYARPWTKQPFDRTIDTRRTWYSKGPCDASRRPATRWWCV
ncbi:zeta toxin family protein [Cupriavidus basilensis]|uniref:zeta toxin family protein n=1 Tax=Cupriavidus basilensis TaxID=68895 RepID=UPI003C2DF8BA